MNQVNLIGNLTRDVELKTVGANNTPVAQFAIAVNRVPKVDNQPDTDYFNIVVWGKTGENCKKYLSKGKKVRITGALRNEQYEKDGQTKFITKVVANVNDGIEFLSPRSSGENPPAPEPEMTPVSDDSLPF